MKKSLVALLLVFATSFALALPAPKDIATAVNSGHLSEAETMLHEVVKEKPGSAKAHYELGQVLAREGRSGEAREELLTAQRLDPSLKFAKDPLRFSELLNKTASPAPAARLAEPRALEASSHAAVASSAPAFPWGYLLLGGGGVLLVWFFFRRNAAAVAPRPAAASFGGGGLSGGAAAGTAPGYGPAPYGAPPAAGSGIGGAVLGGVAGLAAGYGLAKVLEGGSESHRAQNGSDSSGYVPIDSTPQQADYGAFDAGSGDSWDTDDSSSGGDDW